MSYWLEDGNEEWLGNLATNRGIVELREDAPASLVKFLDQGFADAELVDKLIANLSGSERFSYIAEMLEGAEAPVVMTDGCGTAEEEQ